MAEGGLCHPILDNAEYSFDGEYADNLQEQKDEVLALQSIYEGGDSEKLKVLSSVSEGGQGSFTLHLTIPVKYEAKKIHVDIWCPANDFTEDTSVEIIPPGVGKSVKLLRSNSGQKWIGSFDVKYLSPLTMEIILPPSYPSDRPPVFTVSCVWLSGMKLSNLCRQLDKVWHKFQRMPIIFTWIDWLENNLMSHLGITDSIILFPTTGQEGDDDPRALSQSRNLGQDIASMLQHNREKEDIAFCLENQECHVCFDERPGSHFFRMLICPHHFCRDCMTEYCELHVKDGTVEALVCPDTECKAVVPPHIVQAVLSPNEYDRWERLMLQKTLDFMPDIVWCPRCNNPVIREMEEHLNLAQCMVCYFSFCTECQGLWHQGEPCITAEEKLENIEKRQTPRNEAEMQRFHALRRQIEADIENKKYFAGNKKTNTCPNCKIKVEKIAGCNKMTCRCGQSFCWACGKKINGYDHFQTSSSCALWEHDVRTPVRALVIRRPPDEAIWIQAQIDVDPTARQRVTNCPTCKQSNMKQNRNNHIKCWGCKTNFCFMCAKRIVGNVTGHFANEVCTQHS